MIVQTIEPEVFIDNNGYYVSEITNKNTKYNEIDTATVKVIPYLRSYEPEKFDEVELRMNGTPMFTGFVGDVKYEGGAVYEVTAFNNIHKLKVNNININIDNYMKASKLLEAHVFPKADVLDFEISLGEGGVAVEEGVKSEPSIDNRITMDRNNTPAAKIVDEVSKLTNSVWWVNNDNTVIFGPPRTKIHQLEHFVEMSKGKTSPPYQSVKVVGDNVVSKGGWEDRNMISNEPTTSVCAVSPAGGGSGNYTVSDSVLKPPTFVYKSKDIKTQKQADAIAKRVVEKLIQQTKSGHVTVTGEPEIEVYDVIELPDKYGGEKYLVSGLEQVADNTNGYTTKIHIGGLMSIT